MTDAQAALAQVREALAAGPTPGPWLAVNDGTRGEPFMNVKAERISGRGPTHEVAICATGDSPQSMETANARLIAACSPANMTAILAHVEAQAAEIERLQVGIELIETENADLLTRLDLESGTVGMIARECADLRRQLDECSQMLARQAAAIRERDELRRQLAEAEQDARRYRWLRRAREHWDILHRYDEDSRWIDLHGNDLDAAIDAAMGLTRPAEES